MSIENRALKSRHSSGVLCLYKGGNLRSYSEIKNK